MASFADQLAAGKNAHSAVLALEATARVQIEQAFSDWESGHYSDSAIRHRLENIVRAGYRTSAAFGSKHTMNQSGLNDWTPAEVFNTTYLQALLFDVRKNLRAYKASGKQDADRRRAILRIQHSAGVGAQRGYTDAIVSSYKELAGFGFRLRKVWLVNLVNNTPCQFCLELHGTEADLEGQFKTTRNKVYVNLQGPPLHPRCQCYLVVLIVTLENVFEKLNVDKPSIVPSTMSTSQVQSMPAAAFKAVIATLTKVLTSIKGGLS